MSRHVHVMTPSSLKRFLVIVLASGVVMGATPVVSDAAPRPKKTDSTSTVSGDGRKN